MGWFTNSGKEIPCFKVKGNIGDIIEFTECCSKYGIHKGERFEVEIVSFGGQRERAITTNLMYSIRLEEIKRSYKVHSQEKSEVEKLESSVSRLENIRTARHCYINELPCEFNDVKAMYSKLGSNDKAEEFLRRKR